jgi:hypothetical protein
MEVVANSEVAHKSLYFQGAFDAISREYLENVLLTYGYSARMVQRILDLYDRTNSSVQINGYSSQPIKIKSSIRQGCPLSMLLYALCINPLLTALHDLLPGLTIGRNHRHTRTSVTAYADDLTIFLTSPEDIPKLCEVLATYESVSGAKISTFKSRMLTLGAWDTTINILDIPYQETLSILGIQISNSVQRSREASWARTTAVARAKTQEDYSRMLTFDNRVRFIHEKLYARAWYLAQIPPPVRMPPTAANNECTLPMGGRPLQGPAVDFIAIKK